MRKLLSLRLLTPTRMSEVADGKKFLEIWCSYLKLWRPRKYGHYEPLKLDFIDDIDLIARDWNWPFLMERRKPFVAGRIYPCLPSHKNRQHASIQVDFELQSAIDDIDSITEFFRVLAVEFVCDFGFIHSASSRETTVVEAETGLSKIEDQPNYCIFTRSLQNGIPDVFWLNLLGAPYINQVGREPFNNLKECDVGWTERNQCILQIGSLASCLSAPDHFHEIANDIKRSIGSVFHDPSDKLTAPEYQWI